MPIERVAVSRSQLEEVLGIEPMGRLLAIEKASTGFVLVLEPTRSASDGQEQVERRTQEDHGHDGDRLQKDALQLLMAGQTSAVVPQLKTGGKKKGKK